jgi:hypothetical protein
MQSLVVAGACTLATLEGAMASPNIPFKTLRVVVQPNGTLLVGGAELAVTHTSTGNYNITFPIGTWNNRGSACFFVPQVQPIFTSSPAEITSYATFGDGSGTMDVAVLSGADAWLVMTFTSANC